MDYNPADVPSELYAMGDMTLENGRVIEECAVSYVTHGALNADRSNAVLITSSIAGDAHRLDFLIGPGLALDPKRCFVVAVDAIGNGRTTSPSTSRTQPLFRFPRFSIRDMVHSQRRLLEGRFGITHVRAVAGASMGGMQALEWGVSHPHFMDALVAIVPMAKTPAWSIAVNETSRKILMAGEARGPQAAPAPGERTWRAWADFMHVIAGRTPEGLTEVCPSRSDVTAWMAAVEDHWLARQPNAVDWIYQTWAYDGHDVGAGAFGGDTAAALRSIRASTLILSPSLDLYNPVEEAAFIARSIPDARWLQIPSSQGHASSSKADPRNVAFMNRTIGEFLRSVSR